MILKKFFEYYFKTIKQDVFNTYQNLLPGKGDSVSAFDAMFAKHDEESIIFLLEFYQATAKLREINPTQTISFCQHGNVCFPFFVDYVWKVIDVPTQNKIRAKFGTDDIKEISEVLNSNQHLRNWFRTEVSPALTQSDLFSLNEITALQNFSSGGESSFLRFAYPHYRNMTGRMLDAGCGAGFGTLVMSQYMDVDAIDACGARLERATALFHTLKNKKNTLYPKIMALIEKELGSMAVECNFPAMNELLDKPVRQANFTKGSLDKLPYENACFDGINCLDVLEHTFAPKEIIKEFNRVLKQTARIFVTVPTLHGEVEQRFYEDLEGTIFPAMLHLHHFDRASLNQLFDSNGFKEVEITPFDFVNWEDFVKIADQSPAKSLANRLKGNPVEKVARQLFAVYEKN